MTLISPPAALDFLTLSYRPDLHLLVSRWQRPVTAAEFRQGYRATLVLARQVGCPYWQVDLRGRTVAEPASQCWLTHRFLPRVATQLACPVFVGYLLSPQLLRQMPAPADGSDRVAFFSDEGPLTHWLTSCQHRSREALAAAGFTPPPDAAR